MRRVLAVGLLLLGMAAVYSADLPDDPALDKPVTLAVKGEALADIVPMLEKQTGVRVRVAKEIADQKATIFVDDKPLRQVMEGLSTLFGYHWTKKTFSTGDIYELWQDEKSRQSLVDRRQKAWEKAWKSAFKEIDFKGKVGGMSEEDRLALQEQLKKSSDQDAATKVEMVKLVEDDPLLGPYCRLFANVPSDIRSKFLPGMSIRYATGSDEPEWLLPEDIAFDLLNAIEGRTGPVISTDIQASSIGLSFVMGKNPNAVSILGASSVTTVKQVPSEDPNAAPQTSRFVGNYGTGLVHRKVEDYLEFGGVSLPRKNEVSILSRSVQLAPTDLAQETANQYQEGGAVVANRSDILSLLHAKCGLQVISDHYSDWFEWQVPKNPTVRSTLDSLQKPGIFEGASVPDVVWGNDDMFVYLRTKDVWYSDACEVPNRLLRRWATVYRDQGYLGLDEQADRAALASDQSAKLRICCKHLGLPDASGIADWQMLRVLGLLSLKQRKEALSGGTDVVQFTPEQRKALNEALPNQGNSLPGGIESFFKPKVGVWRDADPPPFGTRIDKLDCTIHSADWQPVSMSVREGGTAQPVAFQNAPASALVFGRPTGAPTDIKYTLTITFADGTKMDRTMAFPGPKQKDSADQSAN